MKFLYIKFNGIKLLDPPAETTESFTVDTGLTKLTDNPMTDRSPSISGDGTKIAFVSDCDPVSEIYLMDAVDSDGDGEGDNLIQLTDTIASVSNEYPSLTGDGTKIVFASARPGDTSSEIYLMDAVDSDGDGNGDNLTKLTNNSVGDWSSSISGDGTKVVFTSERDGNGGIYIMDAVDSDGDGNGDNLIRLTNNSDMDCYASLSENGSKLVFGTDRDGNDEVYIANTTFNAFTLANTPTSITSVTVNGTPVSEGAADGWTLSGDTVTFNGASIPNDGDNVEITYQYEGAHHPANSTSTSGLLPVRLCGSAFLI